MMVSCQNSNRDAFAAHLSKQSWTSHTMSLAKIEGLFGTHLPNSVRMHRGCRDKDRSPHRTDAQAQHGLIAAGWEVGLVDPVQRLVTFRK